MGMMRGAGFYARFWQRPTDHGGEAWATFPVEGGTWTCAYRIASDDGKPVLAEIRIYPNDARRPWTDRQSGRGSVPPGGLTARLLRSVKLGHHAARIRGLIEEMASGGTPVEERTRQIPPGPGRSSQVVVTGSVEDFDRDLVHSLGFSPPADGPSTKRGPGRPGRPDLFYAHIAARYVEELEAGNTKPTAAVAEATHFSRAHIRDAVHEARARDLLTPPPSQGRAGGKLTSRASELLAAS